MNHGRPFRPLRQTLALLAALAALSLPGCETTPGDAFQSLPIDDGIPRLRPGDVVLLEVFQEPYMTTRQAILADGTINVGLIGRVRIEGETIPSASAKIASLLDEKHLVNPQVNLTVESYAPKRFTVWGQVRSPGAYAIPPGEQLSLPQAIAMAGGNSDIGDLRSVTITRRGGAGQTRIKLNALSPQAETFFIREGDILRVSETLF